MPGQDGGATVGAAAVAPPLSASASAHRRSSSFAPTTDAARLAAEAPRIRALLAGVNQAQSLAANRRHLQAAPSADGPGVGGVPGLAKLLQTDASRGLDAASLEARRELFGANCLPAPPRATFGELLAQTLEDGTLRILIAAALVSLAVGLADDPTAGYVEGLAILAAVAVVSLVTALNDYQKESQFRELSAVNDATDVVVIRQGLHWQVPSTDLVVGDLVCVEAGDEVPCDGVLVRTDDAGLQLDESALTGEPIDVDKDLAHDPFLLSGCTVEAGRGTFIAIAVGRDSQWGVIKSHLDKEPGQTPLQEKLDDMAALIGYIGMTAAGATFLAMMAIKIFVNPPYLQEVSLPAYALEAFIIGVTIVVVAVPEGLPLAVTISLAFSTKRMLADQNLIRHLSACETMGNATNICSDKTGTLTENRMTVVRGVFADTLCEDCVNRVPMMVGPAALEVVLNCIALCSTAQVAAPPPAATLDSGAPEPRPQVIGNKTEAALLLLAQSAWGRHDDTAKRRAAARFGEPGGGRLFPFSSQRKRMSVLVKAAVQDPAARTPSWVLYHKGAAELVLQQCDTYLDIDGTEKKMTAQKRQEFEGVIKDFASQALRCVALAHRSNIQTVVDPATCSLKDVENRLERNMCFDAVAGIMDPLREDVIQAVADCQRSGIFVRMVTGDNLDTAVAIAKEAGILTPGGLAMVGEDFRKLTPAELDKRLPHLQVLARSSPEDKHTLVQRLTGRLLPETKEQWLEAHPGCDYEKEKDLLLPGYKEEWAASRGGVGEVVGVTGDGTNDAPALKAADVGLSMGLSGTDVAKKASDIIIMDDRFSSIVKAVLWGRSVFDNIRKFLQFQLTVNVVALTITFMAAVVGYQPPLNAVMMLWVNLIMDTMGALALGTEPPLPELLDRRPYRRDASLISRPMWRNIICQAIYQLSLLVFLLNKGPEMFGCEDGSRHHFTIVFNAFVFCQVFNEFNAREIGDRFDPIRSLSGSPMFLLVILFTVVAQWCIVAYGGDFTQTHRLTWQEWRLTVGMGAISLPVGFLMRLIPVSEDPATFAGADDDATSDKRRGRSVLLGLVIVIIPVFAAIVLQLFREIEEITHHFDSMDEAASG